VPWAGGPAVLGFSGSQRQRDAHPFSWPPSTRLIGPAPGCPDSTRDASARHPKRAIALRTQLQRRSGRRSSSPMRRLSATSRAIRASWAHWDWTSLLFRKGRSSRACSRVSLRCDMAGPTGRDAFAEPRGDAETHRSSWESAPRACLRTCVTRETGLVSKV